MRIDTQIKYLLLCLIFVLFFIIGFDFNYACYKHSVDRVSYQRSGIVKVLARNTKLQSRLDVLNDQTDDLSNQVESLSNNKVKNDESEGVPYGLLGQMIIIGALILVLIILVIS